LTPRATDDRVDIAFWEIGEGDPIVILNNLGISHAELEWTVPSIASFYTDLAKRYRVIRYDPRGHGLSGEPPGGWGATTSSGGQ
jgi:pimeloyl-ACP methyl ester carboxylesterase